MTRNLAKAARLKEIERLLSLKPFGVAELARRFGVTRRTIERDLEDLRTLTRLEESHHRYRIPTAGSGLNEVEALAVHSATRLLVHTGVGEAHYRSSLAKLAAMLPEPARSSLSNSVERLEPRADDRVLDLVAQAWFQGRVLAGEYRSSRGTNYHPHEYEIYYYELNRRNLQPYVVARERTYFDAVGVFKLSRLRNVRLLDDSYSIPADFDPHEFLAGAWGVVVSGEEVEVRLLVDAEVASWFYEQQDVDANLRVLAEHPDGRLEVVVTGRLAANGEAHELLSFLLGWGGKVEVLEPAAIRRRLADELRRAARRYDPG